GIDLVLVAGGDGTINEAVNGLVHSQTSMGIVPVGTGNILAHQLHMPILSLFAPLYIRDVGDALLKSRIQQVDVGVINDRHFLCWAGLGLDAEITSQMEPRPRYAKRFRSLPSIITGFAIASEFRGVRSHVVISDRTIRTRALMVVASNIQLYASFFNIAPQAKMDDGLMDIFVFKGLGFSYALRHVVSLIAGNHLQSPEVLHALARDMHVETSPQVAIHLDGDPCGVTPASFVMKPLSLKLLVPPLAPKSLFTRLPVPFSET
ncbi:MAG: YegS/Rv2252/BmrU family lipid kinase, partial [Anaerolineae bacterium]|nr:YegS/Rv2252/BmrU family lipid kinase [Anaerolineae bacterium]